METKYVIMIGAGLGILAGGLYSLLNGNKKNDSGELSDNLTIDNLMDEFEPITPSESRDGSIEYSPYHQIREGNLK